MITFFNILLLLQPMIVNSAFLIVDGCNTFTGQDTCVNNYGWCNSTYVTNTSVTHSSICKEINICPLSNDNSHEICVINKDYYYKFNCFFIKICSL